MRVFIIFMRTSPYVSGLRQNQTDAENLLWSKTRSRQFEHIKFRRQHPIPPYVVDFVCLKHKLVIELDGGEHNKEKNKLYDRKRSLFLECKGYTVIRFWNNVILEHIDDVLEEIYWNLIRLGDPHPSPLPPSRAREITEGK